MRSDLRRNLGLGGLLFVALFVVSTFIVSTPNSDASPADAAKKYGAHTGGLAAQAWIISVAVLVGIAFFWYLRDLLAETPALQRLATIGFGGALIFAASGGVSAGIDFALSDIANKTSTSPTTMQVLNVFNTDVTGVMAAGGVAAFLLATGFVITRSAVLPAWLGWVAVVLGIAALVLQPASPIGAAAWVLIASIVLLATKGPAVAADPAPAVVA